MKDEDNIQRQSWCFVVQKRLRRARFCSTHRISGNSLTSIATSIWMDGVSSSKMMSAMWQITLSNQVELDSWSRDTRLRDTKQRLWIVFGFSLWLNLIHTLILPPTRGSNPSHISCFFSKFIMHWAWKNNEEKEETSLIPKMMSSKGKTVFVSCLGELGSKSLTFWWYKNLSLP